MWGKIEEKPKLNRLQEAIVGSVLHIDGLEKAHDTIIGRIRKLRGSENGGDKRKKLLELDQRRDELLMLLPTARAIQKKLLEDYKAEWAAVHGRA